MPDPVQFWCDAGRPTRCCLGAAQFCSDPAGSGGINQWLTGGARRLRPFPEPVAPPPMGYTRGIDFETLALESLDARGVNREWRDGENRTFALGDAVDFRLAPCYDVPKRSDMWACQWDRCAPLEIFTECVTNCGWALVAGRAMIRVVCALFRRFRPKPELIVQVEGDPATGRSAFLSSDVAGPGCWPLLNIQCWGKTRSEDCVDQDYAHPRWWAWARVRLAWDLGLVRPPDRAPGPGGELRARLGESLEIWRLRDAALRLISANPAGLGLEPLNRPEDYAVSTVDRWESAFNPLGDVPVEDLPRVDFLDDRGPGQSAAELLVTGEAVNAELVIVSVSVRFSLLAYVEQDAGGLGPPGRRSLRPALAMRVEAELGYRVSLRPGGEEGLELSGPLHHRPEAIRVIGRPGDRVVFTDRSGDRFRPPLRVVWLGYLGPGPESAETWPRMDPPESGETFCDHAREMMIGLAISPRRTGVEDGVEIYGGEGVRIVSIDGN